MNVFSCILISTQKHIEKSHPGKMIANENKLCSMSPKLGDLGGKSWDMLGHAPAL
jgi:hypothetical protein